MPAAVRGGRVVTIRIMPKIAAMSLPDLEALARKHAEKIVRSTPDDGVWTIPEEWEQEAAELAHAVMRLIP